MAKTKIRVLRNLASPLPKFFEQQVVEVDEEVAQQLLAGKHAELADAHDVLTPITPPPSPPVHTTMFRGTTIEHGPDEGLPKLSPAEEAKRAAEKKPK